MSIFGDMFESDSDPAGSTSTSGKIRGGGLDLKIPPPPRLSSGLCGIYNQGATCYLNSLLQTLIMTSEFRESLFHLGEEYLGRLEDKDKPQSRVRVIPLHLQKLFARILLSDQQGASTTQLTDSFGWSNREELQQHDVQELNRILFSAIEDSLVGTPGQGLIKDLYHGTIVNQIICRKCGRISEREEDFLDLCLTVAGQKGLEESLDTSYHHMELMEGSNQYRCDNCSRLVDAEKGARIRHLPSILTLSLLRFSFDFQKLERYKETGKFNFPMTLDMTPYCENDAVAKDAVYELFSVVIHSGSTHGGHYHAYIRDVDGLGKWKHPEDEEIQLPTDPATGKVDFIEFDSPIELLQALIKPRGAGGMAVDKLCSELVKQTGVSWNKRFKKQHGAINKFLKRYDDKFEFDAATNIVKLKSYTTPLADITNTVDTKIEPKAEGKATNPPSPRPPVVHTNPPPGYCWFDFDDSRVRPITTEQLEKQFSGKESAYMLFYRKRSMTRPPSAFSDPFYAVPDHLVSEVLEENEQLHKEREEYENKINTIELEVHFGLNYDFTLGALHPLPDTTPSLLVSFDRRKTVGELKTMICEVGGVLVAPGNIVVHHAKELPAGLHLYTCLTDNESQTVMDTPLADRSKVFVWDGQLVAGKIIPVGTEFEPVLLTITHGNPHTFSHGFPKTLCVRNLCELISNSSGISLENFALSRVITKGAGTETALLQLQAADLDRTLADLQVVDGDHFIAEDRSVTGNSLAESAMARQSLIISLMVENRCIDTQDWPVFVVEISKTATVSELKSQVVTQMNITDLPDGGRLRIDDDTRGLRPPMCEHLTVEEAGLRQGMHVIVEPGPAPTSNQITLYVTHEHGVTNWENLELLVERDLKIGDLQKLILNKAGLEGEEWHLRSTNWCGEAAQVLDDLEATLAVSHVENGHSVMLVVGRLPPHGFIQLPLYLLGTQPVSPPGEQDESLLAWITHSIQGLLGGGSSVSDDSHKDMAAAGPASLGELLVSKETTLEELKLQVMTLPQMAEVPVPSPNHLRLRLLEHRKPTTVLRGSTTTVQRLKLTSASEVGVQILPHEEDLNQNQVLLSVQLHMAGQRAYHPPTDLVWDLTRGGAAPPGLRQAISEMLGVPCERLLIAKHFADKYEWMIIKSSSGKANKGKKKGQGKVNLRHAPYHLRDGDVIGVKDLDIDRENQEDFATEGDIQGRERLQQEAEERRKRREENRAQDDILGLGTGGGKSGKTRREVGIKIHVGDFR